MPAISRIDRRERIVITGTGAITPLGETMEATWQAMLAGQSGVRVIDPPYPGSKVRYNAEIPGLLTDFSLPPSELKKIGDNYLEEKGINFKLARRRDLTAGLMVLAAREAIAESELAQTDDLQVKIRRAVSVGSGVSGSLHAMLIRDHLKTIGEIYALSATILQPEQAATTVSQDLKFMGSSEVHATACKSGLTALINGARLLRSGEADVVLVGAVDAVTRYPEAYAIYEAVQALRTVKNGEEPDAFRASQSFDEARGGFVLSAGVTAAVIETESHAKKRGAKILAEIKGYGATNDADHDTQPNQEGQLMAMKLALQDANLDPFEIDYINTHGTGTPTGDVAELTSIILLREQNMEGLKLAATKSMTAHGISYTGLLEALSIQRSIRDGLIPPVPNLENLLILPDKIRKKYGITIDPRDYSLLTTIARPWDGKDGMSISFGFGGGNGSVIIGAYEA